MSDENETKVENAEGDAIDLDTDLSGELDEAMRDALEAIEAGGKEPTASAEDASAMGSATGEADLATQVELQRERALRALADLENYRKRVQRERRDEAKYRAFEPMKTFLAVVDNLERALASEGSVEDLKQGVEMILKQMANLLKDHGVERVAAIGTPFDPSVHEAVTKAEDPNVTAPTVSQEMQSGYTMHERLLRPAVVKVSMPPARGSNDGGGGV